MPSLRIYTFILLTALSIGAATSAQDLDQLKSKAGGLFSSHAGASSSMVPSSLSLGSAKNAAGVLSYCEQQGYLPSAQATLKDKLLGNLGGSQKSGEDESYRQGANGLLQGSGGQSFDLSQVKGKIARKLCKAVADKATSSFLGG